MSTLSKLSSGVKESLDSLAEGWQDLWGRARQAITKFSPASEDDHRYPNRWSLLSAELVEGKDKLTVAIEAPGLNAEDFELLVDGPTLLVRGTKYAGSQHTEGRYHVTERAYGHFERYFTLPAEVDEQKTHASYKQGVLTITLQKSAAAQPRVIPVTDGY